MGEQEEEGKRRKEREVGEEGGEKKGKVGKGQSEG